MTSGEKWEELLKIEKRLYQDSELVYETFRVQGRQEQLDFEDTCDFANTMRTAYYDWMHRHHRKKLFAETKLENK
jgi:hypothetical protein